MHRFFAGFSFLIFAALGTAETCNVPVIPPPPTGGMYVALGDSLSAGVGSSDANSTAFVPLVHQAFPQYTLVNLGRSGDKSADLLAEGRLDAAVALIGVVNNDEDLNNDVRLITLEIGGNDLLALYASLVLTGMCVDVDSVTRSECGDPLREVQATYRDNLDEALAQLEDAGPAIPVRLLTLYNPIGHFPGVGALADLAIEGDPATAFPDGMNDIIRDVAAAHANVTVVDIFPAFQGRSQDLVGRDLIHPNDDGYRAMADAVLASFPPAAAAAP
jgi:lysophospholipase L1-like esterase